MVIAIKDKDKQESEIKESKLKTIKTNKIDCGPKS